MNANATSTFLPAVERVVRSVPKVVRALCIECGHSWFRNPLSAHRCPRCLGDQLQEEGSP